MDYKFKFSIIIPIYNVEKYIKESIVSIVKQSIGFKNNVQLILVNDGSSDNSEKICLEYKNKYPDNIVYIKQKNKGVSSARNNGMKYIEGKYVNFLDSDDKWSSKTLENVWNFFEKHYDEIDLVGCRIKFFEGKKGYHPLDYKFEKSMVIDIDKNYDYIQLNGPTTFIKSLIVKKFKYDENLKYGEDPYFVNQIILEKNKYGVVKNAIYNYRKRIADNSTQSKAETSKDFYFAPLKYYLTSICDYSEKKFNLITKYIQNLVLYELFWRLKLQIPKDILNDNEIKEYNNLMINLIKKIDDEIIINFDVIPIECKMAFFALKYGERITKKIMLQDNRITINNKSYEMITNYQYLEFRKFRVEQDKMIIYGKLNHIFSKEDIKVYIENANTNEKIYATIYRVDNWTATTYNGNFVSRGLMFRFEIPLIKLKQSFKIYIIFNEDEVLKSDFSCIKKYDLNKITNDYHDIDKKAIISKEKNCFVIERYKKNLMIKKYFNRNINLIKQLKMKSIIKTDFIVPMKNIAKKIHPLKNIIILESNPDFSDSVKSIFYKLIENNVNDKYEIVWFVSDPNKYADINIKNVKFIKYFDSKNPNYKKTKIAKKYYRDAKIIIDSNKYINKCSPKQKRIHVNHGSPFKNAIGYNINIGDVDYIIVQSKFFAEVESQIRDTDVKKIIPLGFPRNDILYKNDTVKFDRMDKVKGKKVLWLPTYKVHKNSENKSNHSEYGLNCVKNEKELIALNERLIKDKTTLFIKFHPAEDISVFGKINLSNIIIIKDDELKESEIVLYQLFNKVDALITDYSSVYFDFCLTKKNIGLAISDIDEYTKDQGDFQYKYKDVIIGNYMYNNKDLLKFIDQVSKNKDETYNERIKLIKQYDDYRDGKSTERFYEFLKRFL